MSNFKYDKNTILDKTNGGLDVFRLMYPDCEKNGRLVHFKTHNEDTPSTMVKKMNNGIYMMTNFGGDGKAKNCFDALIEKEGLKDFGEACKWIASELSIEGLSVQFNKPNIDFKAAKKHQEHGEYYFEYHETISEEHLKVLGPLVTNAVCQKYNVKSCREFTQIKNVNDKETGKTKLTQIITKSTDKYPIFVIDNGSWQKIYQPLNIEKQYRFRYAGKKPKDYIFGIDNLIKEHNDFIPDPDDDDDRLPRVFIGAGDRDSLNIASLNEPVVWQNSETALLSYEDYRKLTEYAKEVIYIGDLDETGINQTIKLALSNIDIKIGWLPDWIKEKSYRGKPRKDFTDWINLVYDPNPKKAGKVFSAFNGIITDAQPARFWDVVTDEKGKFKKYTLSNERLYRFLTYNGFYIYKELPDQPEFDYVKVSNGVVKKVFYRDLNNFPANYIKSKRKPIPLVDFIHRSAQLKESSLSKIPEKKIDFKDCGVDHQLLFFKNKIWKVNKDAIEEYRYGNIDAYVWEHKIIQHNVSVNKTKSFEITPIGKRQDKSTIYDIKILQKDNLFLNYLINTSRVHWRVCGDAPFKKRIKNIRETDPLKRIQLIHKILEEKEEYRLKNQFELEEEGLSPEQIQEQKDQLVNKIFAFGYLLHKEKRDDKPWLVFAMDNRISDIADSNGGSGKSVMFNRAIRQVLLNSKVIAGRDKEVLKSQFMYDGVSEQTDYVLFDDADPYFPMTRVFTEVTGDFNVNAKHRSAFSIPFEKSPKFAVTSNFGLFKPDSSTERRILYTVFSDYYHYKSDLDDTEHTIAMDMGKLLFKDFDENEWNDYFNFCAEAIQFHIANDEKIGPPTGNVSKRNSLQTMGDAFKDWADFYFENRRDVQVVKKMASDDFEAKTNLRWTSQKFKSCIKEWCKFHGYEYNPDEVLNKQGHNKHNHQGTAREFIYIKSSPLITVNIEPQDNLPNDFDPTNDIPY
ncbi:primase-helicase family protein [Aquimarina gracilis]|uniref:Primase-helicase family protein n=1 Tax=Aquimarina gracilis TaxID=874422 RepID=A0ABU5ZWU6_9FLAO|nr:primase-helicase family protein [Aquimarina gracilis]MEB3346332.1 primase-helicase family protein [Aquimarina gracilis]